MFRFEAEALQKEPEPISHQLTIEVYHGLARSDFENPVEVF